MFFTKPQFSEQAYSIVHKYVQKYNRNEENYLPILWKQFLEVAGKEEKGHEPITPFKLRFAAENKLNLVTHLVIITVTSVLQELNIGTTVPTLSQIKNAVHKCAIEFGASHKTANQIESSLPDMLLDVFSKVPKLSETSADIQEAVSHVINVNRDDTATVDGKHIKLVPRQVIRLLCEFIRQRQLHWLHGFLIFKNWVHNPPKDAKRQFENVIAKLHVALGKEESLIHIQPEKIEGTKSGIYELIVPENVSITGDIEEARVAHEHAARLLKMGNVQETVNTALQGFQKDPNSVRCIILFSQVIQEKPECNFDKALLPSMRQSLNRARANVLVTVPWLDKQLPLAEILASGPGFQIKCEFEQYLKEITQAKLIVDKLYIGQKPLSSVEAEFETICELVNQIRKGEESSRVAKTLLDTKTVKNLFNRVHNKLRQIFPHFEERRSFETSPHFEKNLPDAFGSCMYQKFIEGICVTGKHPSDFNDNLKHMENSWSIDLTRRCAEKIAEELTDVTKEDQALLRDYRRVLAEKKLKHNQYSSADLARLLNASWDRVKIDKAKAIEDCFFIENIDTASYWSMFRKRGKAT